MRAKILNASAGSGKTYQLAYKYVHDVVEQPALYRHILAVTFTNKATEEMKSRILREIHALASGAASSYLPRLCADLSLDADAVRRRAVDVRAKILHDYSHFTVLTIDTFFQRILRAFIKELGIDLDYNVEIETASVLAKGTDALIEQVAVDADLQRWMREFVEERIDDGRKWDVREGILSLAGELFKEKNKQALSAARPREELRRIVSRLTAQAEAAKQQLRQTAGRAVETIEAAGLSASDFTGKSRSFVRYFWAVAAGERKPYTATVARMSRTTEGWCPAGSPARVLVGELQPLLGELCALYDANVRLWNTCDLLRENYRGFALLSDLYEKVRQLCDAQNTMLLPETKYVLAEFIGHNDAPFIYEKVGNRFERFMIDEFQDTSVREWENFRPLLENAMAQSEKTSVLLVGDIKQSIYRWRGGDWRLLHHEARTALGEADTEVELLDENFRSLPVVVAFNNSVIARTVARDNAALNSALAEAAARGDMEPDEAAVLHDTLADAYRGHAQTPRRSTVVPGYVSVETFAERPPVVERICALLDKGFRPSEMMILVRSATDGAKVAAELLEFKSRNTEERYRFDVMTREALIVGNAPVASFLAAAMRLALNPEDTLERAVWNHYLDRPFDRPLPAPDAAFFRSIRLLSPEEAFERIVMRYDLQNDRQQTAYLQAVHEQILAFCANRIADIPLWLAWWEETGSHRSLSVEASEHAIEITTVHKAKGLEKAAVLIPYCAWQLDPKAGGVTNIVWAEARGEGAEAGRFPVKYKRAMAESGFSAEYYRELVYAHVDNINLLYVALTRAAESLHIFVPQKSTGTVGSLLLESLADCGGHSPAKGASGTGVPDTNTPANVVTEVSASGTGVNDESGSIGGASAGTVTDDHPTAGAISCNCVNDESGSAGGASAGTVPRDHPTAGAISGNCVNDESGSAGGASAGTVPRDHPTAGAASSHAQPVPSCRRTVTEAGERFEFGEFTGPAEANRKKAGAEHVVLERYPTSQTDVRLRLPAQRYAEEGCEAEISPRNFGILMHRAFERADDEAAIRRAVEQMRLDGTLGEADAATLSAMIDRALENPVVREWFGGGWQRIRCENEIVVPGSQTVRRPDRVMCDGRRAVVVDYKFGTHEPERYRRQIRDYCSLLRQMGYTETEGYLWYVRTGKVERIHNP